jgi:nicotinamide-nucleotide amidase
MKVELVAIGGELLSGLTINRNAAFLSRELTALGYEVSRHTTLPDEVEKIRAGLKEALSRAPFVIATGGLGPTIDDLTRQAADSLFTQQPTPLKNSIGPASGFSYGSLILLPGVPREMESMFLTEVIPHLPKPKSPFYFRRCTLCLLREVEVDPFLRAMKEPDLEIGIYPARGSLQITFRSKSPVDVYVEKIAKKYPLFFMGEKDPAAALHHEMISHKKTLSLAESCTGGALAARLVAIPDASRFFLGSIVAYSNVWKERFLSVRRDTLKTKGAVSRQTVEEMIHGLLAETDADYCAAISGEAGQPDGSIFIAVAKRSEKIDVGKIKGPPDRASAIELAVQTTLGALWRRLVHHTFTF